MTFVSEDSNWRQNLASAKKLLTISMKFLRKMSSFSGETESFFKANTSDMWEKLDFSGVFLGSSKRHRNV